MAANQGRDDQEIAGSRAAATIAVRGSRDDYQSREDRGNRGFGGDRTCGVV
ncbi:hypothetical protein QJS66_06120 [Kocuria rhizophila]|nr:hypothetical protein QJS66_06120 [Kocuria rhizophila]